MKKNLLSKKISEKLKTYGLSAGAVVAGVAGADAQVIYTDVNPNESTSAAGDSILLDLNNDGTDDFSFHTNVFATIIGADTFIVAQHQAKALNQNEIGASTTIYGTNTFFYPYALGQNAGIDANLNFEANGGAAQSMAVGLFTYPYGYPTPNQFGNWTGLQKDKFIGLKLDSAGSTYYGWARFDANPNALTLKDYAYESTAGAAIQTSSMASNITASDVSNNYNGSDLQVTFDKAANEASVTEYRVFVVKNSQSAAFDLSSALAVTSGNYASISPTGSNITHTFGAAATDVDGDPIETGFLYRTFVLTLGQANDFLSAASNQVFLSTLADVAQNVTLADVDNFGDGRDLLVTADVPTSEIGIDEYRILVVKEADAATFDLTAAQSVASGDYVAVAPSGSPISENLGAGANDVDGDPITVDEPYKVFILTVADGSGILDDNLSNASNSVTLSQPPADPAINLSLSDAADFGDGRDLMISFDPAANESTVSSYRVMIVKEEQAASFNLGLAQTIGLGKYKSVNPTGSTINVTLDSTTTLATGGSIEEGVAYVAFVLSKASAQSNGEDALAGPSNEVTLTSEPEDSINSVTEINALAQAFYFTNPAKGQLQIVRKSPASGTTDLNLYDVQGRLIETRRMGSQSESFVLASGTYLVRVTEGETSTSFSVVVQ